MSCSFPYSVQLETKPDFETCMERIYAWYSQEVIDRPPVRFTNHNEEYSTVDQNHRWPTLKERWFDAEYQVDRFIESLAGRKFLGETFPVYWPNLGPNVYPCMLGGQVKFGEVTTWAKHSLDTLEDMGKFVFSPDNEYFRKLNEMTQLALERSRGMYIVGYTDLHHGPDCADALRGTENLCMDMLDEPELTLKLIRQCSRDLPKIFSHFNDLLRSHNQPSVNWMNIPSYESMHVPGFDLAAMLGSEMFEEFVLPTLQQEMSMARHNVLHMDGKGVAKHLDSFLQIPELNAIQWVQGVGEDAPILQWIPLIKRIQSAGKGVVVDMQPDELEPFMGEVSPKGIYLSIGCSDPEQQEIILRRLMKWK